MNEMQSVTAILKARGFTADYDYPGFVCIPIDANRLAAIDTESDKWSGCIQTIDGTFLGELPLDDLPINTDHAIVADRIEKAMKEIRQTLI